MPEISQVLMRRKWMLKAHGQHIVIVNGTRERFVHPLMKAFIWALYLPQYPDMTVEVNIDDRYKPDVVAFDAGNVRFRPDEPVFWGEAGRIGRDKISAIVRRYPDTHFAFGKWETRLEPFIQQVTESLAGVKRSAPVDILNFTDDTMYCVDDDGQIHITFEDVERVQL